MDCTRFIIYYLIFLGEIGSEKGYWSCLCYEDTAQGRHAGEGASGSRQGRERHSS